MCCLFGILDYGRSLSPGQMRRLMNKLAVACEVRGTDATGIAYNYGGELKVYKRPLPARYMHFRVPTDVHCVIGHTRMTTQGDEKRNYNNHPFLGQADTQFALAHNGILYNDKELRITKKLPATKIETDSYVAVQLLEKSGTLSLNSLADMAEAVSGSFAFTVLDRLDNFYVVRGSNPFCLYYWEQYNLYVYASTEEILLEALRNSRLNLGEHRHISLINGDLLHIDANGKRTFARFSPETYSNTWYNYHYKPRAPYSFPWAKSEYVEEIKSVAGAFGYSPDYIDLLLDEGFTPEEVEELLYEGEL